MKHYFILVSILLASSSFCAEAAGTTPQNINFIMPATLAYGDAAFVVTATPDSVSNLPVTFAASGSCSGSGVSPQVITIIHAGDCIVTADQTGDATYAAVTLVKTVLVTKRTLTLSGISVAPKQYDGLVGVGGITGTPVYTGGVNGDNFFPHATYFATPENGIRKKVFIDICSYKPSPTTEAVRCSDSPLFDYAYVMPDIFSTVYEKNLIVTATGVNKVYDSTTTASVIFLDNRDSGDVFTVSGASNFDTSLVGVGKSVAVTNITLTGANATKYLPNDTASASADITEAPAVVSAGGGGGGYYRQVITFSTPISGGGSIAAANVPTAVAPKATGTVLGVSAFKFNRNLKLRSKITPDVTELQKVLVREKFLSADSVTGYFGGLTLSAAKKYQIAHGVEPTGFVGSLTREQLNK
jgi:YDG domain/Putative peptidoglycan binding domain